MPRHPLKTELSDAMREFANLTSDFITEISYQTETKKVWISIIKDGKTIEDSVKPDLKRLIRQVGTILKVAKQNMMEDKKISDVIDTNITLPDKPNQTSQTK